MAKRGVEEQLDELSRLRETPVTEATLAALKKALASRINLVCAKAAQIAADLRLQPMMPLLVACFDRFFDNQGKADPQCWAKNAAAKALSDLGHDESATFLRGCRYVQMEPVWGGQTDTAVTLRSLCTLALVQCADLPRAEKLRHLVASMTDPAETVRIDAIRSIEQMEGEEAALLLRLKAGLGDKRAAVVGQALESLLRLEGERAIDFAREFLAERTRDNVREMPSTEEELVEEAALALGASKLTGSVEVLKAAWVREPRPIFLQAISTSRQEFGFCFLLELLESGRDRDALSALEALSLHRDSLELRVRVQRAVEARGGPEVAEKFRASFDIR